MPDTDIGHNSDFGGTVNKEALAGFMRRISDAEEEMQPYKNELKEIYAEAKEAGFPTPLLRTFYKEWAMDSEVRAIRYALLEAWRSALGTLSDTPLGEAALRNAVAPKRRGRPRKNGEVVQTPAEAAAEFSSF